VVDAHLLCSLIEFVMARESHLALVTLRRRQPLHPLTVIVDEFRGAAER